MGSQVYLPTGWEAKWDATNTKYYYIDHSSHRTQWNDPRINSVQVWTQQRLQILSNLSLMFPEENDTKLRQTLIASNMDIGAARSSLMDSTSEYVPSVSPSVRAKSPVRPNISMSPKLKSPSLTHNTEAHTESYVDDFQVMYIKSHISGVSDNVVRDVLQNCNNNAMEAVEELQKMGFTEREASRPSSPKVHTQITKTDEKRAAVDKLCTQFPFVARQHIIMLVENNDLNVEKSRVALLKEEATRQLTSQFPTIDASVITSALNQCNQDASHARPIILAYLDDQKSKAKVRHQENTREINEYTRKYKEQLQKKSPARKSPSPASGGSPAKYVSSAISKSRSSTPQHRSPSKIANHPMYKHTACALGPDRNLAKGPNPSLLCKNEPLARGPNPLNCKGPDATLRSERQPLAIRPLVTSV